MPNEKHLQHEGLEIPQFVGFIELATSFLKVNLMP